MRIRIHRGASEIGGNCVELESGGHSILLDLGLPLDAPTPDPVLLPKIVGLREGGNSNLLGIVLSHTHGDHFGLTEFAHPSIPVFMGEKAFAVLQAVKPFFKKLRLPAQIRTFVDQTPFRLGPFSVTPYLTDHSAFDAYSLLVEAAGKRVFYSGDIRAHGRKAKLVEHLMVNPPGKIDVLLMEGTTLSREPAAKTDPMTENELEDEIAEQIANAPGLVLTVFSPQNIDRFVTIFRAVRKANRTFIGDLYLAHLLRSLNTPSLPEATSGAFRVYLPSNQRRRIIEDQSFDILAPFKAARIYAAELAAQPRKWTMLFRDSMMRELSKLNSQRNVTVIYSLWPGYLERPESKLKSWCDANGANLTLHHTSGHADPKTIIRYVEALQPRHVIPIHTAVPQSFRRLFANTTVLDDGEWFAA